MTWAHVTESVGIGSGIDHVHGSDPASRIGDIIDGRMVKASHNKEITKNLEQRINKKTKHSASWTQIQQYRSSVEDTSGGILSCDMAETTQEQSDNTLDQQ